MNLNLIFGSISMFLAILTNSLSGPMFKYMENNEIEPSLSASWRGYCMLMFLIPLSIIEIIQTGKYIHYFDRKDDLPYQIYVHVLFAGFGWSGTLLFWINGLNYITTVHASLLVNLHPLLMVIYLYFIGETLSLYDWGGVFLAIFGMFIVNSKQLYDEFIINNNDDLNKNITNSLSLQLFGSILCLLAACSEFAVIVNRKKIKKYVPLMQYTAVTSLITTIIASIYSLLFEKTTFSLSYSTHSINSLFGWFDPYWRLKLIGFGLINGVLCQAGFNFAMQFIDPLLFSSLLLLTIPSTGFVSWFFGIEDIPDIYTILGGSILLIGIGLITYGEQKRANNEKKLNNNLTNDNEINEIEMNDKINKNNEKERKISLSQSFTSLTSPISITGLLNNNKIEQKYSQIHQEDVEDIEEEDIRGEVEVN